MRYHVASLDELQNADNDDSEDGERDRRHEREQQKAIIEVLFTKTVSARSKSFVSSPYQPSTRAR